MVTKENVCDSKEVKKEFSQLFRPENNEVIWKAYTQWLTICLNYWKDDHDPFLKGMAEHIAKGKSLLFYFFPLFANTRLDNWKVPEEVKAPRKKVE